MKKFLGLLCLFLLFSCGKEEITNDNVFELIETCKTEAATEKGQIQNILKGDWDLVYYNCGHCIRGSKPEGSLLFEGNRGTLILKSDFDDTQLDFNWSIQEGTNIFGEMVWELISEPQHPALRFNTFCSDYLFFDETPVDGEAYLFRKQ